MHFCEVTDIGTAIKDTFSTVFTVLQYKCEKIILYFTGSSFCGCNLIFVFYLSGPVLQLKVYYIKYIDFIVQGKCGIKGHSTKDTVFNYTLFMYTVVN